MPLMNLKSLLRNIPRHLYRISLRVPAELMISCGKNVCQVGNGYDSNRHGNESAGYRYK